MIDPKNNVVVTGGLVADPEVINENIIKFRVAVDYAGNEKGSQNTSGYFDVTFYTNNDENVRNAKFVKGQIADGKMKKGSQVSLMGRLVQERWTTDDKKGAKVVIVAEAVTYAGGNRPATADNSGAPAQADLPSEF